MSLQIIWIQGEGYVEPFNRPRSYESGYGGWMWAYSILLICPRCKQYWAELTFEGDKDSWPRSAYCEHCAVVDKWHPVPGSVFVEEGWGVIDTTLLNTLPDWLVKREFNLHMRTYEQLASSPFHLEEPNQCAEDSPNGARGQREDLCATNAS